MVKEISMNDKLPSFSLEATRVVTCKDSDLLGRWATAKLKMSSGTLWLVAAPSSKQLSIKAGGWVTMTSAYWTGTQYWAHGKMAYLILF